MAKTREQKLKETEEDLEYLRQVDVPESQGGGRKYVHDTLKEEKAQVKKKDASVAGHLGTGIITYLRGLANYGQGKLDNLDLGKGWETHCIPTKKGRIGIYGRGFETKEGVLVIVRSPSGKVFIRGINVTKLPDIDMKALNVLVEQAENTADNEKGILYTSNGEKKTKSGIYLV